jgi:hypothetical protein
MPTWRLHALPPTDVPSKTMTDAAASTPETGRMRSWVLWNMIYPEVRSLALRDDADGLLDNLNSRGVPDDEDGFSERALAACALAWSGRSRRSSALRPC